MSHLLKKNKNILLFFRILVFSSVIFTILYSLLKFEGNKYSLLLYSVLINYIFLLSFRKKTSFFEFFFGILLWLGFWFKFFIFFIYTDFGMYEGLSLDFINLPVNEKFNIINNAMFVSCFGFIGYILASYLTKLLIQDWNFYYNENWSINFQNLLIILVLILVLFVAFFNLENLIYQRGMISESKFPFLVNSIIKWLLLFGFSSIISIFNSFSIFLGIYKSNKLFKLNLNIKYFIIYFSCIIFFFIITSSSVNLWRTYFFNYSDNDQVKFTINLEKKSFEFKEGDTLVIDQYNNVYKALNEILSLIGNRWVGIDAVVSVENYKNKSFELFYNSFSESFNPDQLPYYERIIHDGKQNYNSKAYGIKTPGIMAFLYFSGSKFFLFFNIFLITFSFILFEKYILKILSNPIFCCLIMQVIAYRFAHFGYLPKQSYLLFGSIILTISIHYVFTHFFLKKN